MTNQMPTQKRVKVNARGGITLPLEMRRALKLEKGDEVLLIVEDGKITLESQQHIHDRIRGKYAMPGVSLMEELLQERRDEAAKNWW
jgi:AbrB family looped-hinge helix DNA binding protein